MVFGIGEGSIDIKLSKLNYTAGELMKGKIILDLNAPKKAKELRVELIAEQVQPTIHRRKTSRTKVRLYEYKLPIKREGTYSSSEYDFELKIPTLAEPQKTPEGAIGTILSATQALGITAGPIRWYVKATLDIPLSLDITKQIQISIT